LKVPRNNRKSAIWAAKSEQKFAAELALREQKKAKAKLKKEAITRNDRSRK
jgi:hypothetical protein